MIILWTVERKLWYFRPVKMLTVGAWAFTVTTDWKYETVMGLCMRSAKLTIKRTLLKQVVYVTELVKYDWNNYDKQHSYALYSPQPMTVHRRSISSKLRRPMTYVQWISCLADGAIGSCSHTLCTEIEYKFFRQHLQLNCQSLWRCLNLQLGVNNSNDIILYGVNE